MVLLAVCDAHYNFILINPRHACAVRVTAVVLCVCLSAHAILAVRATKSITKDIIVLSVRFEAILKLRFSLKECFLLTTAGVAIFS